jgi:hypothetical protein
MNSYFIPYKKGGGTIVDWDFQSVIHCLTWHDSWGYAHTPIPLGNNNYKTISIQRLLMNFPNKEVDHINGRRNDNRYCNLRHASRRENAQNQKQHRNNKLVGASFEKDRNKFRSRIVIGGKIKHIGRYNTEREAHNAYMNEVRKLEE